MPDAGDVAARGADLTKYKATRTEVDGIWFDSKREAARYLELRMAARQGQIRDLVLQPEYPLACGGNPVLIRSKHYPNGRKAKYIADFRYMNHLGKTIVEDVKGMDTPLSRLKRAMVEAEHGIRVVVV